MIQTEFNIKETKNYFTLNEIFYPSFRNSEISFLIGKSRRSI